MQAEKINLGQIFFVNSHLRVLSRQMQLVCVCVSTHTCVLRSYLGANSLYFYLTPREDNNTLKNELRVISRKEPSSMC